MPPLAANARMYAVAPAARDLWRRLLEWSGRKAGVPLIYVEHAAPAPLEELWSRDDLGLAFMCGYPFARAGVIPGEQADGTPVRWAGVKPVAAPVPADPRCGGRALYWTDFVVAADAPFRSLEDTFGRRIGWTVEHSQSGFNALRHHLLRHRGGRQNLFRESAGPLVTPRQVVEAVLSGEIDVGPLDSYVHDLLRRFEPRTAARLRAVASTDPTPMPLLVASAGVDPALSERLRQALIAARDDADMAGVLAALGLAGFAAPEPEAYRVLLDQAAEAEAAGYPVPA
jgi:ABC-type phosphate/phosphonate transport system substrate-binding protein